MRIHRVLAEACEELLGQVFTEGKVLDRVVSGAFRRHPKWGKRDRGFVAESVWEVVRWRRMLELEAGTGEVRGLLTAQWRRMGFQIPEWWEVGQVGGSGAINPNRAVRESVPDWLDLLGVSELGESWDAELAALNRRAPVFLRVNRLQGGVNEAKEWLEREGCAVNLVEGVPNALVLDEGKMLPKRLLEEGRIEIQDAGSQQVVGLLKAKPGMKVIDACAGAGGKTLQLASEMGEKGEIIALDVSESRLKELKRRVRRAGARNVWAGTWDQAGDRIEGADRVLIDAPCSGLGTLRRQPDLKWRLSRKSIDKVMRIQRSLLEKCHPLVAEEGKLIYATCSILRSENERQMEDFLRKHPEWEMEDSVRISTAETGWDGFFAARIGRK